MKKQGYIIFGQKDNIEPIKERETGTVKKVKPYNVGLIIFSFIGAVPIFISLLMLYYYFVSKAIQPPAPFRGIFEIMIGSRYYSPIWSEASKERIIESAFIGTIFGIGIIVWAIYEFWWKNKFSKQV